MAWLRTIAPEEAEGRLAEYYAAAVRRAGRVFQIVRMMSLAPRLLEASMAFYQKLMLGPGDLDRSRREMLAVVVSKTNACHY
ncbi:MAG TPA: peroxidase [Planctomycetes bacterium]|nr:peroxidase [Planctomycetota bacterium]